ncbi:MAG: inner membrane CreD family protein [Acidobacteriota bacterium]|nr:MAG: inner membrane CreD family protein [Acidobacteriota bacterium]
MQNAPEKAPVVSAVRTFAIIAIFTLTTIAWFILGGSIVARTDRADRSLRTKVEGLWGSELEQPAPFVEAVTRTSKLVKEENGEEKERIMESKQNVLPERSDVETEFWVDHRRKGLLWYNTYRLRYHGRYAFLAPPAEAHYANVRVDLPAAEALYDDIVFRLNGEDVVPRSEGNALITTLTPPYPEAVNLEIGFMTQGLDRWYYVFEKGRISRVKDFTLTLLTHFDGFDFPDGSLSPTTKEITSDGWKLVWNFKNLMANARVGIQVPQKLNPGPTASRITFFAPVSLLFFFFVFFMIAVLRKIPIHPMNYFFLAAAFFAFHLLFAYLVDHLELNLSFVISSMVSLFLVVSYLRLVVGMKFALIEAGLTQLVYLVLFSYAFFWEGYTGLTVTIGAVVTLFVVMQLTGRVNWDEEFSAKSEPSP